ncbi:MAG: hypothetical protein Q9217_006811 [Psora testacea]
MASVHLYALFATCWSLLWIICVSGHDVSPQNDTSGAARIAQFTMDTVINNMGIHVTILPLTNEAGLNDSLNQLQQIQPSGPLFLTTGENVGNVQQGSIAFISCEPGDYTTPISSQRILQLAAGNQPNAIVLYSTYAISCTFQPSNGFEYGSMYTMFDASSSRAIVNGLQDGNPQNPQASIYVNQSTFNGTGTSNGTVLGRSPTTAVAMIILYSITGIITALFLIIIVVGAVRAHRHPERYGPRHVVGRPRQSRAKGIARAMLETLPIVKFGDREDDNKPQEVGRDVELGPADAEHRENTALGTEQASEAGLPSTSKAASTHGPDVVTTEAAAGSAQTQEHRQDSANPIVDTGLACSVCTDDFVKGQDIRVLPCKHKFHPECIDPWLLNVSGTCPLCRIDLHPTTSNHAIEESDDGPSLETRVYTEQPPTAETTANETTRRNRRSRILSTLNIGRMRHATPQERIEALRTLRSEGLTGNERQEHEGHVGGDRAINRISRRFGRALGSRPPSSVPTSRPVSEVPPAAMEPQTSPVAEVPTTTQTEAHPEVDQRR